MVLCDPSGNLVKDTTGICWGEILKTPKYPNGEFESIFWVKEANSVYGELSQSQLSTLGSRGKAAKIMSPYLKKEIGLN
jgi:inosine/xanthosine triphosphate pyrophosphatase family protein